MDKEKQKGLTSGFSVNATGEVVTLGGGSDCNFEDRRRFPRYPCTGQAEILQKGKRWGWGKVSDISRGGCYIETMHPLSTGTEAQIRLTIAGILLEIVGNVVSSDPMFGMGMDFVVVPTEQWNKLPQIIEKVSDLDRPLDERQDGISLDEVQLHMQAALQHLAQARKDLQTAMHGRSGDQGQALRFTERAINEVTRMSTIGTTDPASIAGGLGWSCEVQ